MLEMFNCLFWTVLNACFNKRSPNHLTEIVIDPCVKEMWPRDSNSHVSSLSQQTWQQAKPQVPLRGYLSSLRGHKHFPGPITRPTSETMGLIWLVTTSSSKNGCFLGENGYTYLYGRVALLCSWNYHNIVKRLYSNIK